MEEIYNSFDGYFEECCQRKSVPIQHLTVIRMLVDGLDTHNKGFSQKYITISQLIPVYNSLKLYGTVRSKGIIDNHISIGSLCFL